MLTRVITRPHPPQTQRPGGDAGPSVRVRPAWAWTWRWKSSPEQVTASPGEQGQPRDRRCDGGRTAGLAEGELGAGPRGTPRGHVPADSSPAADDPEDGRGRARARHPDRAGPSDPTGAASGPPADLRSHLLRSQLRVPSWSPGARCRTACAGYVQEGRRWVVDVDLERFFDRVNHDILMGKLAKRMEDKRVLRLIRRYLEAGVHGQRGGHGAA